MNKFERMEIKARVFGSVYNYVNDRLNDSRQRFEIVERGYKQKSDYKTGELLWEDEEKTIPKMEDRWDYVDIQDDEITDEERFKLEVYEDILKILEATLK